MLIKAIKFTNFVGETKEEKFYFNLSKVEAIRMELKYPGGMINTMMGLLGVNTKKIKDAGTNPDKIESNADVNSDRTGKIVELFEDIILTSYGKRSDNGDSFIKTEELKNEFKCSAAYEVLFMELLSNPVAAASFVEGIYPKMTPEEMTKLKAEANTNN